MLLIPLKPGVALLPNVEIRPRPVKPKDSVGGAGAVEKELEVLACETDYLSYGETVMVVPDVRSSTVGIGDMSKVNEGSGSVVWLESLGA